LPIQHKYNHLYVFQQHARAVAERKRSLTDLKRTIRGKKDDNSMLNTELNDINVAVNERRHIHEVVGKLSMYRYIKYEHIPVIWQSRTC